MSENIDREIEFLRERFENAPDSRLFAPLADAYRKVKEIDKAVELLEEGIEKHPDYASAHVILGKCFYDKGATERAKTEFERVLELDPENMVALKFLGDILLAEGKKDEAAEYYKKLLAIDPSNEDVGKALKDLTEEFNVKELDVEDSERVRDERPRQLATMTLAGIYAAQGYYNKALKIYREILEKEPENREALDMIEKLQSIVDSTNKEREEAFEEEDVLTISLDDISEDMAENSAGGGEHGEAAEVAEGETAEPADEERYDEETEEESDEDAVVKEDSIGAESPDEAGEAEENEKRDAEAESVKEGTEVSDEGQETRKEKGRSGSEEMSTDDINRFQEWIKKLKNDE